MRISIFILLVVTYGAIGCKQNLKTPNSNSVKVTKIEIADTVEYLDWDQTKINGVAHVVSSKKTFYNILGKPDSVWVPQPSDECGASYFINKNHKYVYIKGSEFEVCGDSIAVNTIRFNNPNIYLICNGVTLNNNTTLISLIKNSLLQ